MKAKKADWPGTLSSYDFVFGVEKPFGATPGLVTPGGALGLEPD